MKENNSVLTEQILSTWETQYVISY